MRRYLLRRLAQLVPMLLLVTFGSYALMQVVPGGPEQVLLGDSPRADPSRMAALRSKWGLDAPVPVQYGRWLLNVLHGDLGVSYHSGRPVAYMLAERLPATLTLNVAALALSYLIGLPLGVLSAIRHRSAVDHAVTVAASVVQATPAFSVGLFLVFAVALRSGGLIPPGGQATPGVTLESAGVEAVIIDRVRHLTLPVLTLTLAALAPLVRYTRSSMLEVLREDYVRTARAKGLPEKVVIYRHAFRSALLPLVAFSATLISGLLGGAAVTEQVFAWPGLGQLAVDAAVQRDYPVVMGLLLISALLSAAAYLLVDLVHVLVDPRIRYD